LEFLNSGVVCNPSLINKTTFSIVLFKTMVKALCLLMFTWHLKTVIQLNIRKADDVKVGVCLKSLITNFCLFGQGFGSPSVRRPVVRQLRAVQINEGLWNLCAFQQNFETHALFLKITLSNVLQARGDRAIAVYST